MQHINDDIDDLLRNAAESYPLKITGANWESIAGRLSDEVGEGESEPAAVVPFSEAPRYRKYLLAMLLIPLGLILAKYAGLIGNGVSQTSVQSQQQTAKIEVKPATKQGTGEGLQNSKTAVAVEPAKNIVAGTTHAKDALNHGSVTKTSIVKNSKAQFSMHSNANSPDELLGGAPVGGRKQSNVPGLSDLPVLEKQQNGTGANITNAENPVLQNGSAVNVQPTEVNAVAGNGNTAANTNVAPIQPTTTKPPQGKTPTPLVHHNSKKARFYIGAFVAPDYTTVKYQPGSKIGFNSGGIVGYTFMKNLSVEIGIAAGRKYYTSSGKYFNSTESWLSSWGKVLNISGYASLTEFPINLKYDFKPGKDGNFFVAGGVVSYIVHQENYDYELDKNGVIYTRDKSPIVATNNLFANANISAGYESSLGGLCNFRIEPYYRIPIKGIGIGGLPITSIGLNIGITKKFK